MDEDYSTVKTIIDKPYFKMDRIEKNKYTMQFNIKNDKLYLKQIINFSTLKILYEVNKEIFDGFTMNKKSHTEAETYFLMKHFFSDFGLPQKYTHLDIIKVDDSENNAILFSCKNTECYTLDINVPTNSEQLNVDIILFKCKLNSDHEVVITCDVFFNDNALIPVFAEKMASIIISKMFIKVKQFIENATTSI